MNSLRETMQQGIEILERSGNPSARAEVEQILMHLLGCQKSDLYLTVGAGLVPAPTFKQLIRQRTKKIPLQYLLGESYFWAWPFKVKPGVFIPRPESEVLVQQTVDLFRDTVGANGRSPLHLLDLGTGSGNLAIALTKLLSRCRITAIEISSAAVEVAKENARRHGVEDRIKFIQEDWSQFLGRSNDRVDGIVANPPYIPSGEIPELDAEVRMEPRQALDGGADGLAWIRILLENVGANGRSPLREGGYLVFEMGKGQGEAVKEIAHGHGWKEFGTVNDLNGIERVFWARM